MIKYLSALAMVALLSACSSDSNSGDSGNPTNPPVNPPNNTPTTPGGPIAPSGGRSGVWFGTNNFGTGVMVIDASENIYALTNRSTRPQYEAVFGPSSAQLQRFLHRDSDNPAFADSFTLAGDLPSTIDPNDSDTQTYNLTVENDGQQIRNSGAVGDFTMTFATENDLPALSLADMAGNWTTTTSFCAVDCNITLRMTFDANGALTGSTQFNTGDLNTLTGGAAVGGPQYLTVSFEWLGRTVSGVLHRDRNDSNRVILNSIGTESATGVTASFTASMVRG